MSSSLKLALAAALVAGGLGVQGCLAYTATKTAVGVTGAVVKGGVAVGRAVIPGDSRDDDEDRRR